MPTTTSFLVDVTTIASYLAVMFLPGLLVGAAAGLRGWVLAGAAPLMSYAIGGLAGPWLAAVGLPFNAATFLVSVVVFAALAFGLRTVAIRRHRDGPLRDDPLWSRYAQFAVLACLVLAAAVGMYTVLHGIGRLNAISQGFDAVYHANGIRYIADTGDGSLFGTGETNWYADSSGVFYPNAYHLIGAVVYQLTGTSVPVILNSNTVLLPGLFALSMVTLVREFRARAVLAGAAALIAVCPVTALYESMHRGPLLPFLVGLALTPLSVVTLRRYLDRPAFDTGFVFVLAAVGLLTVHSSTLFAGIMFSLPMIVQRWLSRSSDHWRTVRRDLLALLPVAVVCVVVGSMQLFGAIGLANGRIPYYGWPIEGRISTAVGSLLVFEHLEPKPQFWLAGTLFLGFLFFARLNGLRWLGGTALLTGLLYVAVSTSNNPLVMIVSRPWWDDPYRFIAMATVPLCLIAAHGLAETQAWLRDRAHGLAFIARRFRRHSWIAAGLAAVVLLGFVGLSKFLYTQSNASVVAHGHDNEPEMESVKMVVGPEEAQAMLELGKLAKPGDWAMNDRFDGTVWTYAISGVRTVAGHFDEGLQPRDALLLSEHFREYETNAEVRAAVQRLNVRWVIVGQYGFSHEFFRQKGLLGLDQLPFLRLSYRNAAASVYQLVPEPGRL